MIERDEERTHSILRKPSGSSKTTRFDRCCVSTRTVREHHRVFVQTNKYHIIIVQHCKNRSNMERVFWFIEPAAFASRININLMKLLRIGPGRGE